jgi:hypothetical protein
MVMAGIHYFTGGLCRSSIRHGGQANRMNVFADYFQHSANLISGPEQTHLVKYARRVMPDRRGVECSTFLLSVFCFERSNCAAKHLNINGLFSPKGAKTRICPIFGCETVKL